MQSWSIGAFLSMALVLAGCGKSSDGEGDDGTGGASFEGTGGDITEYTPGDPPEACERGTTDVDLVANVETIGVVVAGDRLPVSAELFYREAGEGSFHAAHPFVAMDDGRLGSSLFDLSADTDYEVAVRGSGVDGCVTVRTQPEQLPFTPGGTLHVDAAAASGGDGSESAPFDTIQAAVNAASPGTRILVADGVYHESVDVEQSGSPGQWIQIIAAGDGAVLDGAEHFDSASFTPHPTAANVWSAEVGGSAWYVAKDGERTYRYNDLDGLLAGLGDDDVPMDEGFFIEPDETTLWVRSTTDPASHSWAVPRFQRAFLVQEQRHVWIEGFEIRFYGQSEWSQAVLVRDSSHVVVRGNDVHGVPSGIVVQYGSEDPELGNDVRIEDNAISDPPVDEWPWDAVKGTSMEGSAIVVGGHRGAIVRRNRVSHFFNGIYTGRWGDLENLELAFDVDVYDNDIRDIGDDGVEPEGTCINNRFRDNRIDGGYSAVSLAPITVGPTWVLRNLITNSSNTGFKLAVNSDGRILAYHNTSWVTDEESNGMSLWEPVFNTTLLNNVFQGTRYAFEVTTTGCTGHQWDYNDWYTTRGSDGPHFKWENERYDTIAELCSVAGLECHGHEAEPGFTDAENGDFSLAPDSPNIDRGIAIPGINDDATGAPDLGYLEAGNQ